MWDGSFKPSRQVSMRGNSARQAGREDLKEKVRRERERRAREKLEQNASRTVQAAMLSLHARLETKRQVRSLFDSSLHEQSMSGGPVAVVDVNLWIKMLCFSFDDRELSSMQSILTLCSFVEKAVSGSAYEQILFESAYRTKVFCVVLMRLIVTIAESPEGSQGVLGQFSRQECLEEVCSCLNTILDASRWGIHAASSQGQNENESKGVALQKDIVRNGGVLHRRGVSVTDCLDRLLSCRWEGSKAPSLSASLLLHAVGETLACETLGAEFVRDFLHVILSQDNTGDHMEDEEDVMPGMQQQIGSPDGFVREFTLSFPLEAWRTCLETLVRDPATWSGFDTKSMLRLISISTVYLFRAQESGARDEWAEYASSFFLTASRLTETCKASSMTQMAASLHDLSNPRFVQDSFYSALDVVDPVLRNTLIVALCSFYDIVRLNWTTAKPVQGRNSTGTQKALASLAPSSLVVSAVAFSPRDRPLAKALWSVLLSAADSGTPMLENLYNSSVQANEVLHFVSFTVAASATLFPALSDEEIFQQQRPFEVSELGRIALYLKSFLYNALWSPTSHLPEFVVSKAVELYEQLYDRQGRRKILEDSQWLFPAIEKHELGVGNFQASQRFRNQNAPARSRGQGWQNGEQQDGNSDDFEEEEEEQEEEENENEDDHDVDTDMKAVIPEAASPRVKRILEVVPMVVPFNQRVLILDHFLDLEHAAYDRERNFFRGRAIEVRRGEEFEDAFHELDRESDWKKRIQIEFRNAQGLKEAGIDGGGVFKEFLMEFCKQAFDPSNGLWKVTPDQALYPNPESASLTTNHLERFAFIGKMLGKAVYEGILLEVELADFFLNLMLGKKNHLHDLRSLDADLYKQLLRLREVEDLSTLELSFSATSGELAGAKEVDLIPNGSNIPVTRDNYIFYMKRLASFRLNEEFHQQAQAFLSGFSEMIPMSWIQMFKPRELQLVLGGSSESFSVDDMRKYCVYSGGYHPSQPYIQEFWQVVESFTQEERGLLLKFVTSCSRPPLQGFQALNPPLCVAQVRINQDSDRLATASTCMNLLKLPKYSSMQVLREKLLYSISSSSGFELS